MNEQHMSRPWERVSRVSLTVAVLSAFIHPADGASVPNRQLKVGTTDPYGVAIVSTPTLAVSTHEPMRLLLWARAGARDRDIEAANAPMKARSRRVAASDLHVVELPSGISAEDAAQRLRRHPHIKAAEVDRVVQPALNINDPYQGALWHLERVGADVAWIATSGAGVTLAVLDSGVLATHPDLVANVVPGWNVVDNNRDTLDRTGHGTAVAGVAVARAGNGLGVAGLAAQSKVMPVRVTRADGSARISDVAKGVIWAADNGARVVNASFEGLAGSFMMNSAAQYLRSKGGLLFVPSGNLGREESTKANSSMVVVGATTTADQRAAWSSYGSHVTLAAPGDGIWTTAHTGGYKSVSGTSFASPLAAAAAALVMAAAPKATPADVEQWLYASAKDLGTPGLDKQHGYGLLQAQAAVALALKAQALKAASSVTAPLMGGTGSGITAVQGTAAALSGDPSALRLETTMNWSAQPAGLVLKVSPIGIAKLNRVRLSVNGARHSEDVTQPYEFSVAQSALVTGPNRLQLEAVDDQGVTVTTTDLEWAVVKGASLEPADHQTPEQWQGAASKQHLDQRGSPRRQ